MTETRRIMLRSIVFAVVVAALAVLAPWWGIEVVSVAALAWFGVMNAWLFTQTVREARAAVRISQDLNESRAALGAFAWSLGDLAIETAVELAEHDPGRGRQRVAEIRDRLALYTEHRP